MLATCQAQGHCPEWLVVSFFFPQNISLNEGFLSAPPAGKDPGEGARNLPEAVQGSPQSALTFPGG